MGDRASRGDFEGMRDDRTAVPALNGDPFGIDSRQGWACAADGDGAMVGRVLIYASIITVIVAVIIWKQFV